MIIRTLFTALLPVAIVAISASTAQSQDKLDKKVLEIVKQTGDFYKNAKTMHAEGSFVTKGEKAGEKELKVTGVYEVERPSKLAVRTKVDGNAKQGPDVIADGKKYILYRKALNKYTEQESPGSLADIGLSLLGVGAPSCGMLFANILGDDPADLLMQGVTECSYVGKDKVDGTPVHRMKFTQAEFDWELWVAAEGKPYVLRMISTREGENGKVVTTETYKGWKLDAAPPADAFKFSPPKDAEKVADFGQQAR